jgi:hypothetical protein
VDPPGNGVDNRCQRTTRWRATQAVFSSGKPRMVTPMVINPTEDRSFARYPRSRSRLVWRDQPEEVRAGVWLPCRLYWLPWPWAKLRAAPAKAMVRRETRVGRERACRLIGARDILAADRCQGHIGDILAADRCQGHIGGLIGAPADRCQGHIGGHIGGLIGARDILAATTIAP